MMAILRELGVNFRHLLHLKSDIKVYKLMKAGESYIIEYAFQEAIRIKADKAAIVGITKVMCNNEIFMEVRDHFVIKEVPAKYLDRLKVNDTGEFRGITRIPADKLEGSITHELYIKENYARDYGQASGDKNIVHTTKFTSSLFGFGRPFIQGLCTANMIMSKLCIEGFTPGHFSIVFCRPVYLESRVFLSHTESEYRLQDESGRILCFGKIARMS
jgi:acyl dehydratase